MPQKLPSRKQNNLNPVVIGVRHDDLLLESKTEAMGRVELPFAGTKLAKFAADLHRVQRPEKTGEYQAKNLLRECVCFFALSYQSILITYFIDPHLGWTLPGCDSSPAMLMPDLRIG